ncbi:ECF RNA polymerase sigma factor SigD [Aquisphaera giovannonii]|uniref:ECF RNA polymerase sigma factor SigD n=1 Tax=Aquisphaera giovannonii TaxID=406548 RepID=A0A5B9WC76_9BACT|nr:sigma-70 family RNA polymerase sigma factor [Aquisphaera giovannonii]QEH38182.1 ECF RNA polymerase sigma factor SigD [Aquisphaera giovannonii]
MTTEGAPTLDALLERSLAGDASARRELLERHRDDLRRMVRARLNRRLASRIDPSDVVQDALAEASQRLDDYLRDRPLPFLGWLRQLTAERVVDAHRRHVTAQTRSVRREAPGPLSWDDSASALGNHLVANDTSPSGRMALQERLDRVMAALQAMPEKDREILVMRHIEQLPAARIAETLGCTVGAAEARIYRALVRLRGCLEGLDA